MIVLDVEQGSEEWLQARLGIPTASEFDRILKNDGTLSKSSATYMNSMLAEWCSGKYEDKFRSEWMERGQELEAEARAYYAMIRGEIQTVGFIYQDERRLAGVSPDGVRWGTSGTDNEPNLLKGLEIKCPKGSTQMAYLLDKRRLYTDYKQQVQSALLLAGAPEWDLLSYHPDLPPVLLTIERDPVYISAIRDALALFQERLLAARKALTDMGYGPVQEAA